ncbi:MAG: hypothetical protein ACRD88_07285 [Terriglobia bacterium]
MNLRLVGQGLLGQPTASPESAKVRREDSPAINGMLAALRLAGYWDVPALHSYDDK